MNNITLKHLVEMHIDNALLEDNLAMYIMPAALLLSIYPKEIITNSLIFGKIMFETVIFIVMSNWKNFDI